MHQRNKSNNKKTIMSPPNLSSTTQKDTKDHTTPKIPSLPEISKDLTILLQSLSQCDIIPKVNSNEHTKDSILFNELKSKTEMLIEKANEIALKTYEPFLKKYENQIRYYIKLYSQLKLQKESLESRCISLMIKEKEYEKVKRDKNIIIENGEIICNDNKENEIIILRAENSNLKKQIAKYEKKLKRSENREIILFQDIEKENKKLKQELELLNKNFPISQRALHSSSCTTFVESSPKNNFVSSNNRKPSKGTFTEEETTNTEGYSNRYKSKVDLLSSKIIVSPYKQLLSSFSSKKSHYSPTNNNRTSKNKSLSKSKKKRNSKTNIKDTIKSAKGTILNNRKICTINSIKNMFVTTNSMINNYLLYNNNHTNKNSSTRKIYSINQGKNVIENRKISINKSQGQNSKRRMNSQSVLSRAETTRYSINQKV